MNGVTLIVRSVVNQTAQPVLDETSRNEWGRVVAVAADELLGTVEAFLFEDSNQPADMSTFLLR